MTEEKIKPDTLAISLTYGGGTTYAASYTATDMNAIDVIDWLAGAFESFEFGAVSVRISEEMAENAFVKFDRTIQDILEGKGEDIDDEDEDALKPGMCFEYIDYQGETQTAFYVITGEEGIDLYSVVSYAYPQSLSLYELTRKPSGDIT